MTHFPSNYRKKITVCLTIDEDGDTAFKEAGYTGLAPLSRAEYGTKVGLKRILDLLKKHELPATCFIPGEVVDRYSDQCKMVRDAGLEIGHHGYTHKSPHTFSEKEEIEDMEKGLEALNRVLGVIPKGYRAPWLHQSERTYQLLADYGFEYDSSECGQESPYYLNTKGKKLLEIPSKYELIDTPLFLNFAVSGFPPFPVDPEAIEKIWKAEFTGMYESDEDLYYVHVVHPGCIGHFSRLKVYENLIEFMLSHPDVTFSTLAEVNHQFRRHEKKG